MVQAKPGRSDRQEQEQNAPNLGPPLSRALYALRVGTRSSILSHQKKDGIIHTTGKTQRCLNRLANCLEALYMEGLNDAHFWIIPIRRKYVSEQNQISVSHDLDRGQECVPRSHWCCALVDMKKKHLRVADSERQRGNLKVREF